jgi:DNA-binding MarR family transcriptional regulator
MIPLTEKGTREFQQLNKASDDQINQLINPLPESLRQELVAHMQAIMDILKNN